MKKRELPFIREPFADGPWTRPYETARRSVGDEIAPDVRLGELGKLWGVP